MDQQNQFNPRERTKNFFVRENGLKRMKLSSANAKSLVRRDQNNNQAKRMLQEIGNNTDLSFKFDIPEGVSIDELNKAELQYYSFQRRTAHKYVSTIFQKIRKHDHQNPHMRFPISNKKEQMTGRITYDAKGNIVRIKMVKWTSEDKLQEFFLHVLQNMNPIPNPPKSLVHNGEVTVYYTLKVGS